MDATKRMDEYQDFTNISNMFSDIPFHEKLNENPMTAFAIGIMAAIILMGSFGNLMVLIAFKTSKKLQTISNVFVLNLSICDLVFTLGVLPFSMYTYTMDGWYLTGNLCKFIGFLGYTLTGTTLINIALIAWNRYKLVTDLAGYQRLYTRRNIILMLVACWVLPGIFLIPALLEIWGKFGYVAMMVTCNLYLTHDSQSFKLFLLIIRAVIPCLLIIYCYTFIYRVTRESHRRVSHTMLNARTLNAHNQRHERHLTRMMMVIFIVFAISYFPCTISSIIDWNTVLSKTYHMYCQITVYIGSSVNPLIYGLMNEQYQEAYLNILRCRKTPENRKKGSQKRNEKIYIKLAEAIIEEKETSSQREYQRNEGNLEESRSEQTPERSPSMISRNEKTGITSVASTTSMSSTRTQSSIC
ncbi:unnamed protein product [Owenia fusiformis]|uniref:Uncharacterized protein n=1 Tax=Owenia fusiformis TaxID=6347 RepID=A0A8J1XEC1_OWEFU|nr:unnamed protein product [Owenia fusiformis]